MRERERISYPRSKISERLEIQQQQNDKTVLAKKEREREKNE